MTTTSTYPKDKLNLLDRGVIVKWANCLRAQERADGGLMKFQFPGASVQVAALDKSRYCRSMLAMFCRAVVLMRSHPNVILGNLVLGCPKSSSLPVT